MAQHADDDNDVCPRFVHLIEETALAIHHGEIKEARRGLEQLRAMRLPDDLARERDDMLTDVVDKLRYSAFLKDRDDFLRRTQFTGNSEGLLRCGGEGAILVGIVHRLR